MSPSRQEAGPGLQGPPVCVTCARTSCELALQNAFQTPLFLPHLSDREELGGYLLQWFLLEGEKFSSLCTLSCFILMSVPMRHGSFTVTVALYRWLRREADPLRSGQ